MNDTLKRKGRVVKAAKLLSRIAVSVLCLLLLIALSFRIYLATPYPASRLSRFMTSYLHQEFSVQKLTLSDGALVLKGVRLNNPAGFPGGSLLAADSVAIAPKWWGLLRGRQRFRLIALDGVQVTLDKNARGAWNFSQLRRLLAARKPSAKAPETFVRELVLRNGTFKVRGEGVQGISLRLFDLSSKGSLESSIDLAFEDARRNRYYLKGKGRPGADAALDLTLTAPSLSLKDLALLLKLKNPGFFEGGKGGLRVDATLHRGEVTSIGDFSFGRLSLAAAGKRIPLQGRLRFSADYSSRSDTVRLRKATLSIENLAQIRAEGGLKDPNGERQFALSLATDELDLSLLNALLPPRTRRDLVFAGGLRCDSVRLAGDRNGVRSATGTLQLRDGAVSRGGELLVAGLSGAAAISREDRALLAKGRLHLSAPAGKQFLQALELPFTLATSPRLKPTRGEVPAFSARIDGTPVTGSLSFDAERAMPLAAHLEVPEARIAAANPLLKPYGLQADSGTGSATVDLSARSAQDLDATARVRISGLRGRLGPGELAVGNGSIGASLQRRGGRLLLARGELQLASASLDGKGGDIASRFRTAEGVLYLEGVRAGMGKLAISVAQLRGPIPEKRSAGGVASYPLSLDIEGGTVRQGDLEVSELSGALRGSFNSGSTGKWLEGTADLSSRGVARQGKKVAAPSLHALFSRSGGRGELGGELLGGKLAGSVSLDPFAPGAGTAFDLRLSGADLAAAAFLLPAQGGVTPSAGLVDLRVKGGYSGSGGLAGRFEAKGSGIALTGAGGKRVVSGAGLSVSGALGRGKLSLEEALLAPGPGVALRVRGEVASPFSPEREGTLLFSLPQTPLGLLVDPFVNILPRLIQEATVGGAVGAEGKLELGRGREMLHGALRFAGVGLEVPSEKFQVADLNGSFPFSLDLAGESAAGPRAVLSFSRENYPRLLEQLRQPTGGELVTVGRTSLGALELGKTTLHVSAGNGSTEIISLSSALYQGTLLGTGFFSLGAKPAYRGDLLVHGISMRALCSALGVQGYIAGRVDGVISLAGKGSGVSGMTGFAELWAREGGGEKMVVSKEFLQRLAKQKLSGFFFSSDRPYDKAEIKAILEQGDLSFQTLQIVNTNIFGVRDLKVTIAPGQNRIALDHLLESVKEAAVRGRPTTGERPAEAPAAPEFKWEE